MRLEVRTLGTQRTAAHPEVSGDGPGLAIGAEAGPDGEVLLSITYAVDEVTAAAYRRVGAALAVTVEAPDLGLCGGGCLVEEDGPREAPRGPSWRGLRPPAGPADLPSPIESGWRTASVHLIPPPDRPVTLYARAALRDLVSAACAVVVLPPSAGGGR